MTPGEEARADHVATDGALRAAIAERRLISFDLAGRPRIAEPHDYGIAAGAPRLLFYQVGGESRSGQPFGWRSVSTVKMTNVRVLAGTFAGARRTPSGRHKSWETILASVSMPAGPVPPRS